MGRRPFTRLGGRNDVLDAEDVARVASERESIECEACEDGYPSYRLCPFGPESNGAA